MWSWLFATCLICAVKSLRTTVRRATKPTPIDPANFDRCFYDWKGWCTRVADPTSSVDVVVSTFAEDIAWLGKLDGMNVTVYVHNRTAGQTHLKGASQLEDKLESTPLAQAVRSQQQLVATNSMRKYPIVFQDIPNIGDEALPYLLHIVSRYDDLPEVVFFVHGDRCTWHMHIDLVSTIQNVSQCFAKDGGHRLRSHARPQIHDHNVGHDTSDNGSDHGSHYVNLNDMARRNCYAISNRGEEKVQTVTKLWDELLSHELGPLPTKEFCMDCCAQFVVSRKVLQAHPKSFYEHLLDQVKQRKSTLEYFWRLIFLSDFH